MNDHPEQSTRYEPDRRDFLQSAGRVSAGLVLSESVLRADAPAGVELSHTGPDQIPQKPFGRTKETVSVIGLGGYSLGSSPSREEAVAIVHEAIEAGVNFLDNAWEYHDGKSEEWMGQALKGGMRDKVFLMTKVCTHGRDKKVAMKMLEESLTRRSRKRGSSARTFSVPGRWVKYWETELTYVKIASADPLLLHPASPTRSPLRLRKGRRPKKTRRFTMLRYRRRFA
jgi:hypothetical protein